MEQKTISPKEQRALDKVKRANAELGIIMCVLIPTTDTGHHTRSDITSNY